MTFQTDTDGENSFLLSRRGFVVGGLSVALAGCSAETMDGLSAYAPIDGSVAPQYRRRRVSYATKEKPGTIIVDTSERYLYVVEENGKATRYGVGVGRAGFSWSGRARVGRKAEWPTWTPPPQMIRRQPELKKYASGMPGGKDNPLGARALYLYDGGRDTMYRLHGTNQPWSIGRAMSSGCIRMMNADVVHLYDRTPIGTRVVVKA
ncbi:L,D-transpeptidase [Microbaculum marinisediminis]|uniref:L,D-transpeptidase n=1 Tax=Microbaculum marinisediminis TaxID=2931392 RepID=A0AAW5QUP8_9HYPH|nr:L,D-transpeptidase [Microbaculum sp. A6E488]MCT8970735.1 L,D-transpeptidase [Microbaculum sp. A6E488]